MSTFKLPDIPVGVPVTVKKPPVKVSPTRPEQQKQLQQNSLQSMKSALPSAMPTAMSGGSEMQTAPALPDRSWNATQSSPEQITASDLLAGDREIWAKGVILAMVLGKPRCKSKGWR